MKVKILRSASEDLKDGYSFYERQSPGVGEYFIDTLFSDIDSLMLNGGIHPIFRAPYHRMLSKRFPHAVFYRMEGAMVVVYAVLDCWQNPAPIDKRLP